jgi:hypothetical protein
MYHNKKEAIELAEMLNYEIKDLRSHPGYSHRKGLVLGIYDKESMSFVAVYSNWHRVLAWLKGNRSNCYID